VHGWRKQKDPHCVGHTGYSWSDDCGIRPGRCKRQADGGALGRAAVAERDSRLVAVVLGTTIGALIGARTGRGLDEAGRACIGHALELVDNGKPVRWMW
jgi:surface antigen